MIVKKSISILLVVILLYSISFNFLLGSKVMAAQAQGVVKAENQTSQGQNITNQNTTNQAQNTTKQNTVNQELNEVTQVQNTTSQEQSNTSSVDQNVINELTQEKDEVQNKLDEVNKQLEYVKTEMSYTLMEIQKLDDKIRGYEQQNKELATKLTSLETSIKETTQKLTKVTEDYNKKDKLLKQRLAIIYEQGTISYLDVLLSANSLSEFLSIYYAIIEMTQYDNDLMEKVNEERKEIDLAKRKLEHETAEVKILKAKAEQTEVVLKNAKTLQEGYIETLTENENEINKKIQEYKNDILFIEAKIAQVNLESGQLQLQYTGGQMLWPVVKTGTVITSQYGTREHPISGLIKFHQGLDIAASGIYGTPAVAALDGKVTYSGWLGSYGNCVMIYHGNGITTLYAHGDHVIAKYGQEVKQGEPVLAIGSTGNSTGPHLHFEVRINGSTTNPLNYVKAP